MTKFKELLIGATLAITFVFLIRPTIGRDLAILSKTETIVRNKNRTCFNDTDCNGHGRCPFNGTDCDCDRGWVTHGSKAINNTYCGYEQRSKKTAFLLSFFLGSFGIDWFYLSRAYLGYINAGILKLLFGCGCCSLWPLTHCESKIGNSWSNTIKIEAFKIFCSLASFAWWIVDWARILDNRFHDGRGVKLAPW